MEKISEIILENQSANNLRRIEYAPYSIDIALDVMINKILRGFEPEYHSIHKKVIKDMIMYVHADQDGCSLDIEKAIGLIGPTGTGKTLTFKALAEYMKIDDVKFIRNGKVCKFGFEIVSSRHLTSKYSANGIDGIQPYVIKPVLCIDDLGSEPPSASHYGNKLDLVEHLIEERHLNCRITHWSSNLNLDAIHERYGDRVYSRIKGATNIIELTGKDWRI